MKRFWPAVLFVIFLMLPAVNAFHFAEWNTPSWFSKYSWKPNPARIVETPPSSCIDSDNGRDYFQQGAVTLDFKKSVDLYGDRCQDSFILIEYLCADNEVQEDPYRCEAGCFKGVCINPQQDDSVFLADELAAQCGSFEFASPRNAYASSDYSEFAALNAIDADANTHWFGNASSAFPKWIVLDLGESRCIDQIDLYFFRSDLPLIASIQASNDAIRWKTVLPEQSFTNSTTLGIVLESTALARYIRVYETSGKRPFGSLSEIRVRSAQAPDITLVEFSVSDAQSIPLPDTALNLYSAQNSLLAQTTTNASGSAILAISDKSSLTLMCKPVEEAHA
ncbi:discoidin domain-containing protein [Candidatus Pacearchaeota archaeon]|nr:discoidin domain-containing protein [Candidatus Pacearchaeota archaeon]